jgi:hypothetical protein
MPSHDPRPRRARMQPFAGLLVTLCLALLAFSATAAAGLPQPVASSAALRTAVSARAAAERALASSSKALQTCLHKYPNGCQTDRWAVKRARAQLTSLDGRIAKYSRHHGSRKTKGATNPSAPTASLKSESPAGSGSGSSTGGGSSTGSGSGSAGGSTGSPEGSTGSSGSTSSSGSTEGTPSDPATPVEEATPPAQEELQPRSPGSVTLGLVGASGWGPAIAAKAIAAGFKSERFEADNEWMPEEDKVSYENGFRNDQVIVGNTPDATKLSAIDTSSWVAKALEETKEAVAYNYTLIEVGNEMYLKGGQSEPVKYAEMYMALASAIHTAGIKGVTLIFDSFGDYRKTSGEMSEASRGGGWLGDALKAQPALKQQVSAFSAHPYGIPGVKYEGHDWAIEGLEQEHAYAVALGFEHTDYYATEYGEEEQPPQAAADAQVQAERIKWAYTELLSQPYVKGIWYYQLHDDSTGHWGLVSGSWEPRPALGVLEGFLHGAL